MKRRLAIAAQRDIVDTLAWSREQFGEAAARRYREVIKRGLAAISSRDDPIGSRMLLGHAATTTRLYHLRHCRQVGTAVLVRNPRHFLVYERTEVDVVDVLRLLHDIMDIEAKLDG